MGNRRFVDPEGEPPPIHFRAWREFRGLGQRDVEERFGWAKGRLSHLEAGRATWTPHVLSALARTYACTVADLLSRPPPDHPGMPQDGLSGLETIPQLIGYLQQQLAELRGAVVPRLDTLEAYLAEAGQKADAAVENAAELGEAFSRYAAQLPRKIGHPIKEDE